MSTAPDGLHLAPELAAELVEVASALGLSPSALLDRAVRRELARALLDEVYRSAHGLAQDDALDLVYQEKEAVRNPA